LRHIHPLPNGLNRIFAAFKRIVVVEMNDEGVYGFGQLATLLRARYCESKVQSLTKTDGLTYRVKEIIEGVFPGLPSGPLSPNGQQPDGAKGAVHSDTSGENVKSTADVVPQGVG